MDDALLLERLVAGRLAFHRALAETAPGMRVAQVDGCEALLSPAAPERSVLNAAVLTSVPDDPERLAAALADLYRGAGVHAWTVWVAPPYHAATEGLGRAGHVFDGEPTAMALELATVAAEPPAAVAPLDLAPAPRFVDLAALNDLVYDTGGSFARAAAGARDDVVELSVARVGGRAAACLLVVDHEEQAIVELVATHPEARGRGLATGLLHRALLAARDRARTRSTLIATARGVPVYERIGYRPLGRLEMWERREQPPA